MADLTVKQKQIFDNYKKTHPKMSDAKILSALVNLGQIQLSEEQKLSLFNNSTNNDSGMGLKLEHSANPTNTTNQPQETIFLQSGRKIVITKTQDGKDLYKYYAADGTQLKPDYFKKQEGVVRVSANRKTYTVTKNGKTVEKQAKDPLMAKIDKQQAELNKTKNEQGFIGKSWDWFKNKTGIGDGSNKAQKQLDAERKLVQQIQNGKISKKDFKDVTGLDYSQENLQKFKSGEIELKSTEKIKGYQEGQEMACDVAGDLVSGIAAVGIYSAAVAAAPFTGGASIAVGVAAAGASGAAIKTGLKAADAATGGRKYTLKDAGHDAATGAFSGVLAPITGGMGGAVGKTVATKLGIQAVKTVGKEVAEEVVETGVKQGLKQGIKTALTNPTGYEYVGGNIAKRAVAMSAEMASDGAVGGAVDNAFRTALDGGSLSDVAQAAGEGFVGGAIMSPIIGGGFKAVGKAGHELGSKVKGGSEVAADAVETSLTKNADDVIPTPKTSRAASEITVPKGKNANSESIEGVNAGKKPYTKPEMQTKSVELADDIMADTHTPPKMKYNERELKIYNRYIQDIKTQVDNNLSGGTLDRAHKLIDLLQDHFIVLEGNGKYQTHKINADTIIELANISNLNFSRLNNIIKLCDPSDKMPLGNSLNKIMKLSDKQYDKITSTLGDKAKNIDILACASEFPDKIDRFLKFIDFKEKSKNKFVANIELPEIAYMSDEVWDNVLKRDIMQKLIDTNCFGAMNITLLAKMDDNLWNLAIKRNLLNENNFPHIETLTSLNDVDFQKIINLGLYNSETGNLRISDDLIGEFIKLTPEQENKIQKYNLLNRDGLNGRINDGNEILSLVNLSETEWQNLADKKLFDIKVNGKFLKANEIFDLGSLEPETINKILDIKSINSEVSVSEALALSELSKEDIAKIQKFNLFNEKFPPRYIVRDIAGDWGLNPAYMRQIRSKTKIDVELPVGEIINIAQQPEDAIPNIIKLLKNKNVERYDFEVLTKIGKLNADDVQKVENLINTHSFEEQHILTCAIKEQNGEFSFDEIAYNQAQEIHRITDDAAHAEIFIKYCENPDGSHNSAAADKIIKTLQDDNDAFLISKIAALSKENTHGIFDEGFINAFNEAKKRGLDVKSFDEVLKECSDQNGQFSKVIYDKIYSLQAAEISENNFSLILKACKNNDGTLNDEAFETVFKLKKNGYDDNIIGYIIEASKDLSGDFNSTLLAVAEKEINNWPVELFPQILNTCLEKDGKINEVAYTHLLKLKNAGKVDETNVLETAQFLVSAINLTSGKSSITELSKVQKREFIGFLLANKQIITSGQFDSSIKREISSIIPITTDEYATTMRKISNSMNISLKPVEASQVAKFNKTIDDFSKYLKEADLSQLEELNLTLSHKEFISKAQDIIKHLPIEEQAKIQDFYGFKIIDGKLSGYPNINAKDLNLSEITDEQSIIVVNKLRKIIDDYVNNNFVTVKDNPLLNQQLKELSKVLPEIFNQIDGSKTSVNMIKSLQKIVKNSAFENLSESDKRVMMVATLLHNTDKTSNNVKESAFDALFIAKKFNMTDEEAQKVYSIIEASDFVEKFMSTNKRPTETNIRFAIKGQEREDTFDLMAFILKEDNNFELAQMLYSSKYPDGFTRHFDRIMSDRIQQMKANDFVLPQTSIETYMTHAQQKSIARGDKKYNVNIVESSDIEDFYAFIHTPEAGYATGGSRGANFANFDAFSVLNDDKVICTSYVTNNMAGLVNEFHHGFIFDVHNNKQYVGYGQDIFSLAKNTPNMIIEYFRNRGTISQGGSGPKYNHRIMISNTLKSILYGKNYRNLSNVVEEKISSIRTKISTQIENLNLKKSQIIKDKFGTENITREQYMQIRKEIVDIENKIKALEKQQMEEITSIPGYADLQEMDKLYIKRIDDIKTKLGNKTMTLENLAQIDSELAKAYKEFLKRNKKIYTKDALMSSERHNEVLVSNPKISAIFTDDIDKIPEEYLIKAQEENLPIVIIK